MCGMLRVEIIINVFFFFFIYLIIYLLTYLSSYLVIHSSIYLFFGIEYHNTDIKETKIWLMYIITLELSKYIRFKHMDTSKSHLRIRLSIMKYQPVILSKQKRVNMFTL